MYSDTLVNTTKDVNRDDLVAILRIYLIRTCPWLGLTAFVGFFFFQIHAYCTSTA